MFCCSYKKVVRVSCNKKHLNARALVNYSIANCFRENMLKIYWLVVLSGDYKKIQLKSDSHLPKKICCIYFNESPLKVMKNAFYFILKALFVLKMFNFFS